MEIIQPKEKRDNKMYSVFITIVYVIAVAILGVICKHEVYYKQNNVIMCINKSNVVQPREPGLQVIV